MILLPGHTHDRGRDGCDGRLVELWLLPGSRRHNGKPLRMSRDECCLKSPDAIDQIDQGGRALRGIPFGIGQLGAKVLLQHRALL